MRNKRLSFTKTGGYLYNVSCYPYLSPCIPSMIPGKLYTITGAYAGFVRGGVQLEISGILDIHAAKLRAFARGVWEHAPPRKF